MLKRSKKSAKESEKYVPAAASQDRVAEAAYYLAERRGFEPGRELDDWIAAENTIATDTFQEPATHDGQ
jgi:hypothetical protein